MKRYIRLVIILVVSLVAYCSLCGFMYDSPNFNVDIRYENDDKINESFEKDKIFDILVPFDESDEWYTDFNELETEIPKDSELANYSEDGYRSLRCHFRDTVGGSKSKSVNISKEWGKDEQSDGNARHALFCYRYKKCRLAISDENGNIITVSEPVNLVENFVKMAYAYLRYNPETNTLSAGYVTSTIAHRYLGTFLFILILSNGLAIALVLIYLIIMKIQKYCRVFKILSSLFLIPLVLFSAISVLSLTFSYTEIGEIMEEIIKGVFYIGMSLLSSIVSIYVFIFFCIKNKKLKAVKKDICVSDVE